LLGPLSGAALGAEPLVVDASPDWTLGVTAQIRPRVVAHGGLDFRGTETEWREHVSQRTRVGLRAAAVSGIAVQIEVQDVRLWGEESGPDDFSAGGLDVHQAYAALPLSRDLELRFGRLELALDDERLLGPFDFTQRARAFDGGTLRWESGSGRFAVQALYSKVAESGTSVDGNVASNIPGDVDFGGVHGRVEFLPGHALSSAYLVRVEQVPTHARHDVGLHAAGSEAGFSYRVEGHYQTGKTGNQTISAYLAAARVGLTAAHPLEPSVQLHADLLSGGGSLASSYDTLYGSNHDYYGLMDLFTRLPSDTAGRGLIDLGARVESGIVPELRAMLAAHWFRTAVTITDEDAKLGYELDGQLTWAPLELLTLEALAGVFLPQAGMGSLKSPPTDGKLRPDFLTQLTTNVQF
jgi:hypothetical protein